MCKVNHNFHINGGLIFIKLKSKIVLILVIIGLFFILESVSAADNNVTNDKSIVKVHDDSLIENNSNLIKSSNEDNLLKASVKTFEYDGEVHTTSEIQTAVNEGYSIINLGGNLFKKNGSPRFITRCN